MRVLPPLVALLMVPVPTFAGGTNLAWNACLPDGGIMNLTSSCSSNSGAQSMIGSFSLDSDLSDFTGIEVVWDACSMGVPWPSWWHYVNPATCRAGSLEANANFLASPPVNCRDPWQGQASGGIAAYQIFNNAWDSARLILGFAAPAPIALLGQTEYQAFQLTIDNANTTGAGACDGCDINVCIVLNEIAVVSQSGARQRLTTPMQSYSVTWQGVSAVCPFVVPARSVTWGRVKSLYR
jgi:hypothetical protein